MKIKRTSLLLVLTFLLFSCSSEKESPKAMLTSPIDNILVEKAKRQMHLRNGENIVKTYRISLGKNPMGAKVKSGDNKTPEGNYTIERHNPKSIFHLSHFSFIAEGFVPESGANQGRERRQLRARR